MPRIPMPGRQVGVPDEGVKVRATSDPRGAEMAARQKFAGTIDNVLSNIIPDIVLASKRAQVRDEIVTGQVDYNEMMEKSLLDVYKKPDISKWVDYGQQEHDRIVQNLVGRNITPEAKKQLSIYARDAWTRQGVDLALRSKRLIAENERAKLPRVMMSFVRQRDRESFERVLDDMTQSDPANLLPEERKNYLEDFDKAIVADSVRVLVEAGDFDSARKVMSDTPDTELRHQLSDMIEGMEAAQARKKAANLTALQEQTYSTLLADFWDGNLTNPQVVTDAVRDGYITAEDAKSLRKDMLNKDERTSSDLEAVGTIEEALLELREGVRTRKETLSTIFNLAGSLKPEDGKTYIKEAFGDQDTVNSKWDREAWEYIESQILSVSSMTGMLYGSGEQKALAAQAHIKFSEAKKQAAAEGKPIQGEELLVLAHKIMIPFRQQVKPLFQGVADKGNFPAELRTTPLRKPVKPGHPGVNEFLARSVGLGNRYKAPKTVEEFENTFKRIPTLALRRAYYLKYATKVYGR